MFATPEFFVLLALVPYLAWRMFRRRKRAAIRFSSVRVAAELRPTLRQRMLWLPPVLTLMALTLVIVALARPRQGRERTVASGEGIAIEMVVDRSGSMQALDFQLDGRHVDRLTAIKNVASRFILGDDALEGRYNDLVGLITFAGYADSITPPTLDHSFVVARLAATDIVTRREEDGTAIGDAVALAVEKLSALGEDSSAEIKSRVIILLTDGENTAGELAPIQAAELANSLGIKIYAIGVGTSGRAPVPMIDGFSGRTVVQWMQVTIDEETLGKMAELTGGQYFRATDTDSLETIYRAIDQLEKSEVEAKHYVDYRELAVQWLERWPVPVPPLLLLALGALVLRVVLEETWLQELA